MILQALNQYYERLQQDPDQQIAPFGFSRQRISFCVVINADGSLVNIEDHRIEDGKKMVSRLVQVCGGAKPSGSGINPCFLWDNPSYMLGYKPDDSKPERTLETFETFRQKHLDLESDIDDPEFSAVCRFLESWDPTTATEHETLVELGTGFGVFRLRGKSHLVHERPAIKEWWSRQLIQQDEEIEGPTGQCLITGQSAEIARLHEPKIKGVVGGQSAGAAIVSFNLDAFESYGKKQSGNSPVSEQAAFQYCTALNRLLADRSRRFLLGDTTTVFWTKQPTPWEDFFGQIMGNPPPEDEEQVARLEAILNSIAQGTELGAVGDLKTPFYVLGLSPNAARISVRFWWTSTLGELVDRLHQHYSDLEICRSPRDPAFLHPWKIVRETVRDSKDISPLLAGALLKSILTGQPYPMMLLSSLMRRIRADGKINFTRAAAIKACLTRNSRFGIHPLKKEISMTLDPDREEPAYQLGRLFAELEKTQEDAFQGLNATIKDRFFSSASATPAGVFPRLIRMSQHHLAKLEVPKKIYHEKRIQEICDRLSDFPSHMNLRDQGLFAIGYYHQRHNIFSRKTTTEPISETTTATQE